MQQHLRSIFNSIQNQNGKQLAVLLSFSSWNSKFIHSIKEYTKNDFEVKISRLVSTTSPLPNNPWNDIIIDHLKSCILFKSQKNDPIQALKEMTKASKSFINYFNNNAELWPSPIFNLFLNQLRQIATVADTNETYFKYLEECIVIYREFFKSCKTKPSLLLSVVIAHLRVYFKIKSYQKCDEMIRHVNKNTIPVSKHPISQQVTYNYFTGCISMFNFDIVNASQKLSFAYENCSSKYNKNKRLILLYLIPLRLLEGIIPSDNLLKKYKLYNLYSTIIHAFKCGNISLLKQTILEKQNIFLQQGVYLVLEKLQMLTFRNLFRSAYVVINPPNQLILMKNFEFAVNYYQKDDPMDIDEIECMVANLIYRKYIRGYIAKKQTASAVKLDKNNPFPKLPSVFTLNTL